MWPVKSENKSSAGDAPEERCGLLLAPLPPHAGHGRIPSMNPAPILTRPAPLHVLHVVLRVLVPAAPLNLSPVACSMHASQMSTSHGTHPYTFVNGASPHMLHRFGLPSVPRRSSRRHCGHPYLGIPPRLRVGSSGHSPIANSINCRPHILKNDARQQRQQGGAKGEFTKAFVW